MADEKISYEVLPAEGNKDVGLKVYSILEAIIDDKESRGLIKRWNRNYELKRGKHWRNKTKPGVPLITANLIHKHRLNTINSLTDNSPIFNVAKINDSEDINQELYENLQRTAEHWWNEQEQQDIFESSVNNGEDYGIAIEKVIFDPDIEEGGEVETIVVDPFHFGVYPINWTNPRYLQKSLAVLHYYPKSLNEVRRLYPDKASQIKPDEDILKELGDERRDINTTESGKGNLLTNFASTSTNLINFFRGRSNNRIENDEEVLLVEAWVRDYRTVTEKVMEMVADDTGVYTEVLVETKKPKYPGYIRRVTVCNSGQLVLEDTGNPNMNPNMPEEQAMRTYLWDKFPFAAVNSIKDTACGWGHCYDEDTEILTESRGFVKFNQLNKNEMVATRNADGKFEWQVPISYTDEEYNGNMYHLKSRSVDLCVTPNHKMLVGFRSNGIYSERFVFAKDFITGLNNCRKLPVTSKWEPLCEGLNEVVFKKSNPPSKEIRMSGDDYCALLGAYLAEGNLHSVSGIEVAQRETSKGFAAYKALFDRLGVQHDGKRWRIYGKTLKEHFAQFGHADEKFIPPEVRNLPARQLKILWDYFVLGDGNFKTPVNVSGRGSRVGKKVTHITTVSRMLADNLVEIGQKLGWSVSVRIRPAHKQFINGGHKISSCKESYNLCCRYSHYMGVKSETVPYNGRIYCVTVPNGVIYVRRNGKPIWCGNSDVEHLEDLNIEFNKALSQLVLIKDKVSRLKLINPKTSGVPNDALTNFPGILNPVNATEGNGIHYLDYPRVPADLQNAISLFKDMFFLVSGSFDLDMAREPGRAVLAYKAIAALLERVNTMMRGKVRSYSRLIRERGRMYLSMVQNFYTEDRWITYKDPEGNDAYKKVNGQDFRIPFKLTVVTGSTMPVSKIQLREEAVALFEKGAIDQEELLDHLEWSGRSTVVRRMKQGVIGQLTEKMGALGMPEQFAEYMNALVGMKDNDFKRAIRDGQVPKFEEVIKAVQTGEAPPDPKEESDIMLKQAEARAKLAEAARLEAEAALAEQKAITEQVKQQVQMAGVKYDNEQLKIDRAKVVADIQKGERENREFGNRIKQERGMKSNNKEE